MSIRLGTLSPLSLRPDAFQAEHDLAFTVAGSLLTPDTTAQCRALMEAALCDQWSVHDLGGSVKAVLAPSLGMKAQQERGQC